MENLQGMAVIIGLVNGIRLFKENRESFMYFVIAVLLGACLGAVGLFGLTLETGIVVALASSGLYKVAQKVGGE